jgi:hypothetical protein
MQGQCQLAKRLFQLSLFVFEVPNGWPTRQHCVGDVAKNAA